jgi:hypothetical protein
MTEYKIISDGPTGHGVDVVTERGIHSVRGFPTETAARDWIAAHKAQVAEIGKGAS